jgi:hypothetical protein
VVEPGATALSYGGDNARLMRVCVCIYAYIATLYDELRRGVDGVIDGPRGKVSVAAVAFGAYGFGR